jgi:DNA repair exonuclease SbcCD ATPase subunit
VITVNKRLICLLVVLITISVEGCKREVPADNPEAIARAERAEKELADTLRILQQIRREKDLEVGIGATTSDKANQLTAELNEALQTQEQLTQAVETAEAERDQALTESKEAHDLANELEKFLQESEERISTLEKANQELEAEADELAAHVSVLSEQSNEIDEHSGN